MAFNILLRSAEGPEQGAHGHAGIELLRQTQAARMSGPVSDLFGSGAQVVIGVRAIGKTGFGPPIFMPVARIGSVSIRKSKILFGLGVESGLVRQVNLLAVLLLH